MAKENLAQDLSDFLATKNYQVRYTDERGRDSAPDQAKVFAFDWTAPSSGTDYGTAVIVLGDQDDLQLYFGDNLGRSIEDAQDKEQWFAFMKEVKDFATRHSMGTFTPLDINQLKHTMAGMAAIKEGLFEGYYGNRKVSYMGAATEARLVIKHNRLLGENDKRYRYVESLFIETADGERFKLPFVKLAGGRAMLEHVRQGGTPYDVRGQHIKETVQEMNVLARFNRASQSRVFEGDTAGLVESAKTYYEQLKHNLTAMSTKTGYGQYFENWTPADIAEQTQLVEDLKQLFVEQTLDARIEAAVPILARLQQGAAMKEVTVFENWINRLAEGTWALPDTPEANAKLKELMSKELIVGPDATNATEQLYDVIGDDQLFDALSALAQRDPRANVWDDTDVQARLGELGIQLDTTAAADQQQPVAPAPGEQAPGTSPEQDVKETDAMSGTSALQAGKRVMNQMGSAELKKSSSGATPTFDPSTAVMELGDTMTPGEKAAIKINIPAYRRTNDPVTMKDIETSRERTHSSPEGLDALQRRLGMKEAAELQRIAELAQVPVRESVLTDATGHTLDHILQRFSKEVEDFKQHRSLDNDLYDALHDYYRDDMPYAMKKASTGDARKHIADRLHRHLGLDESNSGMIMPEADPMDTFEMGVMGPAMGGGFAEGAACNMTAEGEYCPEHGLSECGTYEAVQDPINANSAITGSYYESQDPLVRLRALAFGK